MPLIFIIEEANKDIGININETYSIITGQK